MTTRRPPVTVPDVASAKVSKGSRPLVMVTAYDFHGARLADLAGVDVLLVGDSLGMVVQGRPGTLEVTVDHVVHHLDCVRRAAPSALVVGDMPWLSYHVTPEDAVRNAGRLVQEGGASAVKIEGGRRRLSAVRALLSAEIPVMGHLGLTPQSVNAMGGFRVQGREQRDADRILEDARSLEDEGVFALVLEGVPADLAARVTQAVGVPTIGIGAGPACDGQVLVFHDLLGITPDPVPRFVRRYEDLGRRIEDAIRHFAEDVRAGTFPSEGESYGTGALVAARPAPTPVSR